MKDRIETEINKDERIPNVVFFLDGLNEIASDRVSDAINAITGLLNINTKIRIILTTRYMPTHLENDFKKITFQDLSVEQIKNYLGRPDINIDKNKLGVLSLPLYLRLYKLILESGEVIRDEDFTKVGILRKVFIENQINGSGEIVSVQLRFAYSVILPYICFKMANSNSQIISDDNLFSYIDEANAAIPDQNQHNLDVFKRCFKVHRDINIVDFKNASADTLEYLIVDQLFRPESDSASDAVYQICHQDIRDFFAAYYVKSAFSVMKMRMSISGMKTLFENTLLSFNPDIFDKETVSMTAGMLPKENEKYKLNIPYSEIAKIPGLDSNTLRLIYMIGNETIENFHNATKEKRNACKAFQDELDLCYQHVMSQKHGDLWHGENVELVGDIMYLAAQIHRRTYEFEKSIQISIELAKFAESYNDSNLLYRARNNIAKCELYQSTEYAKKEAAVSCCSEDVITRFRNAVEKLSENSHYWSSGNLYAMLLAYPDLISGRYLNKVFSGRDMSCRRLEAFQVEYNIWESKHKNIYALQTCLSYVMHDFITLEALHSLGIIPEATEGEKDSLCKEWIEILLKEGRRTQRMPYYFRAQLLLKKETLSEEEWNKVMGDLKASYVISNKVNEDNENVKRVNPVIGCFVYTVLNNESNDKKNESLNIIADTMKDKVNQHNTDNFDYWYVLGDLQNVWEFLKNKRKDEIRIDHADIEKMLTELRNIYNKEAEKWRFI